MFVYLPKVGIEQLYMVDKTNEFTIAASQNIEVNVSTKGRDNCQQIYFQYKWMENAISLTRHQFTCFRQLESKHD